MNDTIEATDLYAMVFSDDELRCISPHIGVKMPECSVEVTHYRRACKSSGFVCANIAAVVNLSRGICMYCGRFIQDCWKVVAI